MVENEIQAGGGRNLIFFLYTDGKECENSQQNAHALAKGNKITYLDQSFYALNVPFVTTRYNLTVIDNEIYNSGSVIPSHGVIATMEGGRKCAFEGTHSFRIENNHWHGHAFFPSIASRIIQVYNEDKPEFPGRVQVIVNGNTFKDMKKLGEAIYIRTIMPLDKVEMKNNVFKNYLQTDPSLPVVWSNQDGLVIENWTFIDSSFSNFIKQKGSLQMKSIYISDLPASQHMENFIQVKDAQLLEASDLQFSNFDQTQKVFFDIQSVQEVRIKNSSFQNLKFDSDFFHISLINNFLISGVFFKDLVNPQESPSERYLVRQEILFLKEDPISIDLNTFELLDSDLKLFQIDKFEKVSSEEERKLEVSLQNFKVITQQAEFKSLNANIQIAESPFKDFQLKILGATLDIPKTQSVFLNAQNSGTIVIEDFKVQGFKQSLFILKPSENQGQNLKFIGKNIEVSDCSLGQAALIQGYRNTQLEIIGGKFSNIRSQYKGSVLFLNNIGYENKYSFDQISFENCYSEQGGVFHAIEGSSIKLADSELKNNESQIGGVVYLNNESHIEFKNSIFEGNSALRGSVLYSISSNKENTCLNCTFKPFQEQDVAQISLFKSKISFQGILQIDESHQFLEADSNSQVSFIKGQILNFQVQNVAHLSQSKLIIKQFSFKDNLSQEILNNHLFDISAQSLVQIIESSFQNLKTNLLKLQQSELNIQESNFVQEILEGKDSYFSVQESSINLNNISFTEIETAKPFLNIISSDIEMNHGEAIQIVGQFIQTQNSILDIKYSSFSDIQVNSQVNVESFIEAKQTSMNILETKFEDMRNIRAIYSFNSGLYQENHFVKIMKSTFRQVQSTQGSAVFIENQDLEVKDSLFDQNRADEKGGSLFLFCSTYRVKRCNYEISGSVFQENQAFEGGAISYNLYRPDLFENTFKDNTALSGLGNDISSFPSSLRLESYPSMIYSGRIAEEPFLIEIIDNEGNIIENHSNSLIRATSLKDNTAIQGISTTSSIKGSYQLSEIVLIGQPGEQGEIEFSSDSIDQKFVEISQGSPFQPLKFSFTFEECKEGEIQKDKKCEICQPGTYQLEKAENQCKYCPKNFFCEGGTKIGVKEGFWRSSLASVEAAACLTTSACPQTSEITCSKGYKGVLCAQCAGKTSEGFYAKAQRNTCQVCESQIVIWVKIIGVAILLLVYIAVIVTMILFSANRNQYNSVLMKILTNYLQVTLMIKSMEIYWPQRVQDLIDAISIVQSVQRDIFQFSCIFQSSKQSPFALTTLLLASLPFFLGLLAFIFWKLAAKIQPRRFKSTQWRNSVLTFCVIGYLSYPFVNQQAFLGFYCKEIEGKTFFVQDFSIECYTPEHYRILGFVILPIILIWTFGFPAFTFYLIRKRFHQLDQKTTIIKYGLFYIGLKDEAYYWEVLINNFKKFLVILASTSISSSQSHFQLVAVFTFIYFYHEILKHKQPYTEPWLNQIELHGSLASISVILLAFFFINEQESKNRWEFELVFFVLFFFNVSFLIRWAYVMVHLNVIKIKKRIDDQNKRTSILNKNLSSGYHYNRFEFKKHQEKLQEEKKQRVREQLRNLENIKGNKNAKLKVKDLQTLIKEEQTENKRRKREINFAKEESTARNLLSKRQV